MSCKVDTPSPSQVTTEHSEASLSLSPALQFPPKEVTAQGTKTPPARPLRGHLLCAGTALPAADSARAPSSARLSSSSNSKVGGDSKDLGAGAMAEEGARAALQRAAVSGSAHPAALQTDPLVTLPAPPTPTRDPQPSPTHVSRELRCS